jgi:hypothetical protein
MRERRYAMAVLRAFHHGSAKRDSGIVWHRRNVKSANRRLGRDLHVHLAIQRDAAGEANIGTAGRRDRGSYHLRGDDFELLLAAGGDIGEARVQRLPAKPANAEDILHFLGENSFLSRREIAGEDL